MRNRRDSVTGLRLLAQPTTLPRTPSCPPAFSSPTILEPASHCLADNSKLSCGTGGIRTLEAFKGPASLAKRYVRPLHHGSSYRGILA